MHTLYSVGDFVTYGDPIDFIKLSNEDNCQVISALTWVELQLVWKNSKKVGFGIAKYSDGSTRVVAQYQPCGNNGNNEANVDKADSKLPR